MRALCYALPTYDDYAGLWGALAAIRTYQSADAPIVVVDNNPSGAHAPANAKACEEFGAEYHVEPVVGNARAKQACVVAAAATGCQFACVLDSHVVLAPDFAGKLARAVALIGPDAARAAIIHGPIKFGETWATRMEDEWRGGTWGTWGDDRVLREAPGAEPFEIGAMGMGVFVVNPTFFLRYVNFAPDLVGFAAEEWYVHTKYRTAGGKAYCAPALTWSHRFHQPHVTLGVQYVNGSMRENYVRQHRELGLDMDRMLKGDDGAAPADWTAYVKAGTTVVVGAWDDAFGLGAEALPGCSLQVYDPDGTGRPLYEAASKYARRAVDPYDPNGTPGFALCDGGSTVAVWAARGAARIAAPVERDPASGLALDAGPQVPPGYWVYRRDETVVVYTCDPADAEPALPGLVRMALNLARTLVTAGTSTAPDDLQATRRAVCESNGGACPAGKRRISDDRCADCGCHLSAKRAIAGASCPLGYW